MRKLGKVSKRFLIGGISTALVGIGLYAFNVTGIISIMCIVTGTICIGVGTPYINGVEYSQMLEEQQLNREFELAAKREYVKNNMHKFGIGTNVIETETKNKRCPIISQPLRVENSLSFRETDNNPTINLDKPKVKVRVRKINKELY